jgi:hypothetical protein
MRYVMQENWFSGLLVGICLGLTPITLFLSCNYLINTMFLISNTNEKLLKAGYTNPKYIGNTSDHNCNEWLVEGKKTVVCMINGKAYFPVD